MKKAQDAAYTTVLALSKPSRTYLARKHVTASVVNSRGPNVIPVADVLALYARDVAPEHARPKRRRSM